MKHFHGTPIGGQREQVAKFAKGRFLLVPFARPEDLPIVADVSRGFALDNSAFTVWKQGGKLDFEGVMEWYREWANHPRCDLLIIPDEIEGSENDNDKLLQRFLKNATRQMADKAAPVWHLHESLDRLRHLSRWRYLAIGSSGEFKTPGTEKWLLRMSEVMKTVCDDDGRPRTRIHGLRMLSPAIIERYPFWSADSTNVAQNANLLERFGNYKPPTQSQRCEVIASRIEAAQSPAVWKDSNPQQSFDFCIDTNKSKEPNCDA